MKPPFDLKLYGAIAEAPPAGGGQVIMIQMSFIPLLLIAGIVFAFILRGKNG